MNSLYAISVCISLISTGNLDESQINSSADKTSIDEIKKLGAIVGIMEGPKFNIPREKVRYIVISKDWKGKDDGLKYVDQITNAKMLILVGSVYISDARLKELAKTSPQISIQRRKSDAHLGIAFKPKLFRKQTEQTGVPIDEVVPNSAAAKADIRAGDFITECDDKTLKDSDEFLELMGTKKVGDEIALTINRNGESTHVKAKLGSWMELIESRE